MKLGMTGSREGISENAIKQLEKFINETNISEAHHGDCVGADMIFHNIVSQHGIKTIIHPPKNNKLRAFCKGDIINPEKEYIARNHDIVDCTDILLAFPVTKNEVLKSGTWATIRYAKKQNKEIIIMYP